MSAIGSEYARRLDDFRALAKERWTLATARLETPLGAIPPDLPGFLVDRYAFRLFIAAGTGEQVSVPDYDLQQAADAWEQLVQTSLVGEPSLGISAPRMDDDVPARPFLHGLFERWRTYLCDCGIDFGGAFVPTTGTWRSLLQRSALYPRPPVLVGPNYFSRLSPRQREHILNTYGDHSVVDFYIFLLQVHEESHLLQTGEPLMCEVTHAWLWCDFLTREDLWLFQRNDDTGAACNVESEWLPALRWSTEHARAMFADTRAGVTLLLDRASYYEACRLGSLLDSRALKYREYLAAVTLFLSTR